MKIITSAPTKIILTGEHFVVWGGPGLALPIERRHRVALESRKGEGKIVFKSNLGEAVYFSGKFEGQEEFKIFLPVIDFVFPSKEIPETLEIEFLPCNVPKGMGSSASLSIALAFALFCYLKKEPKKEEIFQAGQLADEIAHKGKPSGIDAMTIARGRPQKFQRSFNPPAFRFEDLEIILPRGTSLMIVDTYKAEKETTGQLIEKFAISHGIRKKPEGLTNKERENLLKNFLPVFEKFLFNCKEDGDPKALGVAFNENHKLLSSVSTPEIEKVRKIALENGAFGAKLTGAGGKGGAVIVLIPQEGESEIKKALENEGFFAFNSNLAFEGPRVEMVL